MSNLILVAALAALVAFAVSRLSRRRFNVVSDLRWDGRKLHATSLAIAMLAVVACFSVLATPALATGHGQQAVVVQEYVVQPQFQQQGYVLQQNAACVAQQFNAYSAPLVHRKVVRQRVVPQKFVRPQRVQRVQRPRGGNFSSITIQRERSGRGFLRNLLPF